MANFKVGSKVKCVGNRGIEYRLPSDVVMEVVTVKECFGHEYLSVSHSGITVNNVRSHRFVVVEE